MTESQPNPRASATASTLYSWHLQMSLMRTNSMKIRRRTIYQNAKLRTLGMDLSYEIDRVIEACIYGEKRPECAAIARRRRVGLRHVVADTLVETLCREFVIRRRRPTQRPTRQDWVDRALSAICWPWFWLTRPTMPAAYAVTPSIRGVGRVWDFRAKVADSRSEYADPMVDIAWGVRETTRHLLEHYEQEPWRSELAAESQRSGLPLSNLLADAITNSVLEQFTVIEKDEAEEVPF